MKSMEKRFADLENEREEEAEDGAGEVSGADGYAVHGMVCWRRSGRRVGTHHVRQ